MNTAANLLTQLRADLGDEADALMHLPLHEVETATLQDDEAVSFGIHFGYLNNDGEPGRKEALWLHMYPATRPDEAVEIHVNSYYEGMHKGRYDPKDACKDVTECAAAFKITGSWFKGKLIALAKYYFLEKLAELDENEDELQYGMPISKTFLHDLKAICRVFETEARSNSYMGTNSPDNPIKYLPSSPYVQIPRSIVTTGGIAQKKISGDSTLTNGLLNLSDEDDETLRGSTAESHSFTHPTHPTGCLPTPEPTLIGKAAVQDLLTLDKDENKIQEDVDALEGKITKLQQQRAEKEEQLRQVHSRKVDIFQGLSPTSAYNLGRQVQRAHMKKRQKKE